MSFDVLRLLQVICGIGLIVFVHELGHFLAARISGVRVAVFSIGFGPALLERRIGQTLFQLAPIPLGGFCRFAGEERRFEGTEPLPDELAAQGVGKRFFIYSAGVLANIAFVLVVYPFLFSAGVPFQSPTVGSVTPGSAAWQAGVEPGMEVISINGKEIYEFSQIPMAVLFGNGDPLETRLRDPKTGEVVERTILPRYDDSLERWTIGIRSAVAEDPQGSPVLQVREDSSAYRAGLRTGMGLIGVVGADPGLTPLEQLDRAARAGDPLTLRVRDGESEREVTVEPEWIDGSSPRLGIRPVETLVTGVRPGSRPEAAGLREGDRILAVGDRFLYRARDLRDELTGALGAGPVVLRVLRDGATSPLRLSSSVLGSDPQGVAAFLEDLAVGPDLDGTRITVQPGEAGALAGLRDGDRLLELNGVEVRDWLDIFHLVQESARSGEAIRIQVERRVAPDAEPTYPLVTATPVAPPAPDYGITFRSAQYTFQAEGAAEAVRFGMRNFIDTLESLWFALRGVIGGSVKASDSLGGPIAIVQVSYSVTGAGWSRFLFFLCFISLNLAVVNLLPIPALDGGHLMFLIIEKIKGSPVSDRVLGYSQMVGVVLLLSVMIFVTYNDILRLIGR